MNRKNFECTVSQMYKDGGYCAHIDDDNLVKLQHKIDDFIDRLPKNDDYCIEANIGDVIDTKRNKVIIKGWKIKL